MNRSSLRNQFLKNRSIEPRIKYNEERNICIGLLRKSKRKHYEDLRLSDVNNNKKFWKSVKQFFRKQIKCKSQGALAEDNNFVTDFFLPSAYPIN